MCILSYYLSFEYKKCKAQFIFYAFIEVLFSMFYFTGASNNNLEFDVSTLMFGNAASSSRVFDGWKTTQKIYVKDAADQS